MQSGSPSSFLPRLFRASLGSLAGAAVGALVLSVIPGASHSAPIGVRLALVSPLTLVVGIGLGGWVTLVHSGRVGDTVRQQLQVKQRRARLLMSGLGGVVALWVVGQLGLRLLVAFSERPAVGGVLLASLALGCFTFTAWGVDRMGHIVSRRWGAPSAAVAASAAVLVPVVVFLALVGLGDTSGTGGALALFGVFKRDELSLLPVLQIGVLVVGGYLASVVLLRRSVSWLVGATIGAVSFFSGSVWALVSMSDGDAIVVERGRGLERVVLLAAQRLDDRDGDGFSGRFGGGDCDDTNAAISPEAKEIAGNGVDENCSGHDLPIREEKDESPEEQPAVRGVLPENANVLLLSIDTLRDDLGFNGYKKDTISPSLDALAERSTVFENAYALASYTSKSLGPMLIGRYPSETQRTFEHFDRFAKTTPFLQERLKSAGIHTVSVQGYWYFFFKGYGMERGWDVLNSKAAPKLVAIEGDKTSNGDELASEAILELERLAKSKKRFFAWTHWVDPHAEYVAHEEFDYGNTPRERYDGEVSFVDRQVGRVIDALERFGLKESTVVIVTSDHGEAFGEHGMIRHGFEVWEELVRIPLIVHVPGAEPKRVKARRSMIDIAPTIVESLDGELPTGNGVFRGKSLLSDVFHKGESPSRPVLVDMPKGPHNKARRAFYQGDHKLIVGAGRVLGVYDLKRDPGEKNDLSTDGELVKELRESMDTFLQQLEVKKPR